MFNLLTRASLSPPPPSPYPPTIASPPLAASPLLEKICNLLPAFTRMHSWQVGSQVMIQFLKVLQTDDPKRVIHCVHQAPTNKRNDPGNERLVQHLDDHWVWESTGVPILRLHQTQNKHTNKSRHAIFVEGRHAFSRLSYTRLVWRSNGVNSGPTLLPNASAPPTFMSLAREPKDLLVSDIFLLNIKHKSPRTGSKLRVTSWGLA